MDEFLASARREVEERHARFGRSPCVQEPNVKEGAGGLRDLHAVLWVARARYATRSLDDLVARGRVSVAEYAAAGRAYEFLSRVRNEAHFVTGRPADLLTLDLQPEVAAGLGYRPGRSLRANSR